MLPLLALLVTPVTAHAADDCLITVDKDIKDPAPGIYVNCSVAGERLDTSTGIAIEKPDGKGGTTETVSPFGDVRLIWRSPLSLSSADGPMDVTVGVGAAFDESGKPRRRRGTCVFEDYVVSKEPTRRSCSVKLDGNDTATEVDLVARLNAKGRAVFKVVLPGNTFTADEEAVVDVAVADEEGTSLGSGALRFRRSRASATIAFTDTELSLFGKAAADSTVWDDWSYDVLAADGKTSLLAGETDIEPDILDGIVDVSVTLDGDAALELDVRGRADRDQDVAGINLAVCDGDCSDVLVIEADLRIRYAHGVAAKGTGDPLGQSWTITSTGYDTDGKAVAGPYKVTVTGVEGRESGTRNITGGSLRKDGASWRLGRRGGKRVAWLEWDNSEVVFRSTKPAAKWTHVVVAHGKSTLSVGSEVWRDQRLRADLSGVVNADTKAMLEIFSAEDFDGSVLVGVELTDSAGKTVSKDKDKGKTVVTRDKGNDDWSFVKPYSWP